MSLGGDRPVGHRSSGESFDDLSDWFHLVDRQWRAEVVAEAEQTSQGGQFPGLFVDSCRVLAKDVVTALAGGVLETEHGFRVEQVHLTLATPLVLTSRLESAVSPLARVAGKGQAMPGGNFLGQHVVAHPV